LRKPGAETVRQTPGFFRQESCDCRGIAGVLFVPERDYSYARSLRHTAQVRDRDARYAVDRIDAVELERIDDEMKAIRQLLLRIGCICVNGCGFQHRRRLPDRFLRTSSSSSGSSPKVKGLVR
jgi:hypothetical protein